MTHSIQPIELSPSVEALLSANHLPTSDLQNNSKVTLFGCAADSQLLGVVGLEMCGPSALLRSLAVPATERGNGLGAALVAYAEQYAARQGADTIYLLTTTAAGFFERHGYSHVARQTAPASIAATSQFSDLCPSSSAFMAKPVGS
jgi:amino-acid N-acetyltransferase